MRRKKGALMPLELAVLEKALAFKVAGRDEFHGFEMAHELDGERGKTLISHGTMYKTLGYLLESKFLQSRWESPDVAEQEKRPRRRYYSITAAGQRTLYEQRAEVPANGRIAWEGAR